MSLLALIEQAEEWRAFHKARGALGNIEALGASIRIKALKDARAALEAMRDDLIERLAELEENGREYERIVGPKTYKEVADDLRQAEARERGFREVLGYVHDWLVNTPWGRKFIEDAKAIDTVVLAALSAYKEGE